MMERAEEHVISKDDCKNNDDVACRMLEELHSPYKFGTIEQMSSQIADKFDLNKTKDIWDSLRNGSQALSEDLQKLSGNMEKYNELLLAVKHRIPGEPAANPYINLEDWNSKTGTWDNVSVTIPTWIPGDAVRIVQPGNTLSEIARDKWNGDKGTWKSDSMSYNYMDFMNELVRLNKIQNPNKIEVGQAIALQPLDKVGQD